MPPCIQRTRPHSVLSSHSDHPPPKLYQNTHHLVHLYLINRAYVYSATSSIFIWFALQDPHKHDCSLFGDVIVIISVTHIQVSFPMPLELYLCISRRFDKMCFAPHLLVLCILLHPTLLRDSHVLQTLAVSAPSIKSALRIPFYAHITYNPGGRINGSRRAWWCFLPSFRRSSCGCRGSEAHGHTCGVGRGCGCGVRGDMNFFTPCWYRACGSMGWCGVGTPSRFHWSMHPHVRFVRDYPNREEFFGGWPRPNVLIITRRIVSLCPVTLFV